MKMLNVGIGPGTGNTRELNSGDIDLQSGQGISISYLPMGFYI